MIIHIYPYIHPPIIILQSIYPQLPPRNHPLIYLFIYWPTNTRSSTHTATHQWSYFDLSILILTQPFMIIHWSTYALMVINLPINMHTHPTTHIIHWSIHTYTQPPVDLSTYTHPRTYDHPLTYSHIHPQSSIDIPTYIYTDPPIHVHPLIYLHMYSPIDI